MPDRVVGRGRPSTRSLRHHLAGRAGRRVGAGELVYLEGDAARSIFLLRSGLIKTSLVSQQGDERILRVHQPEAVFGELGFCQGERREQAMALEPSVVVELTFEELVAWVQRDAQVMLELLATFCERLGAVQDQLRSITFDTTMARLARTLLKLADELGVEGSRGTQITHYIKQADLARMIGARREVVSGLLKRLRDQGLVQYVRRGPISVDRTRLVTHLNAISES